MRATIYGVEFNSAITGNRRLAVVFYFEREQAVFAAKRIDRALEPEIVEFYLDDEGD